MNSSTSSVKSDALVSYQPPFNILAFILLKPASWVLSPRALHSFNVFLIRVTSLPQLIIIGIYERHLATGRKFRETGKEAAQSLFNSLPRQIKSMPLVEALVGSSSNDLFDAIFEVEIDDDDYELFGDSDADMDLPALRSLHSKENLKSNIDRGNVTPTKESRSGKNRHESPSPVPLIRTRQPTRGRISSEQLQRGESSSAQNSPRLRRLSLSQLNTDEVVNSPDLVTTTTMSNRSPLAKLFASRFLSPPATGNFPRENSTSPVVRVPSQAATSAEVNVRQIATLLENVKELPVQKLKDEMKELQVGFREGPFLLSFKKNLNRIVKHALRICCFCWQEAWGTKFRIAKARLWVDLMFFMTIMNIISSYYPRVKVFNVGPIHSIELQ